MTSQAQAFVDTTVAEKRVVIFSKSWCPHCDAAKDLFKSEYQDEEPFVVELDKRDDGAAIQTYLLTKTSQRTVPNIFVRNKHIGGADATRTAHNENRLRTLLAA